MRRTRQTQATRRLLGRLLAPPEPSYHTPMGITTGTVVGGKVHVDGVTLPEGSVVTILTREPRPGFTLSPADEAELLESIAEAERGETISAEELFARLDRAASQ
jgi:hypothetical protein